MRVVLFLGSGFSAPFGLPTMESFLRFVDGTDRVSEDQRRFVYDLLREARQANSFLQSSPTNLEDMLSFAVMGDRLGIYDSTGQPRGSRLTAVLRQVFSTVEDARGMRDHVRRLGEFLGEQFFNQGHEVAFVTTNYDVHVDCAVHALGKGISLGFQFGHQGGNAGREAGFMYATPGIGLFKLHGSVNWFTDANPANQPRVDGRLVEIDIGGSRVSTPACSLRSYELPGEPIIVPPTFAKPELGKALKDVWTGAARALQRAHLVVFVGYSFPPSDIEMKYFLARSLTDNLELRRILLVGPQAEAIRDRLIASSSGFGSHFQRMLKCSVVDSWEYIAGPGILTFA